MAGQLIRSGGHGREGQACRPRAFPAAAHGGPRHARGGGGGGRGLERADGGATDDAVGPASHHAVFLSATRRRQRTAQERSEQRSERWPEPPPQGPWLAADALPRGNPRHQARAAGASQQSGHDTRSCANLLDGDVSLFYYQRCCHHNRDVRFWHVPIPVSRAQSAVPPISLPTTAPRDMPPPTTAPHHPSSPRPSYSTASTLNFQHAGHIDGAPPYHHGTLAGSPCLRLPQSA